MVALVAEAGRSYLFTTPLYPGDVVVEIGPGASLVTSGPPFFWTRWRRLTDEERAEHGETLRRLFEGEESDR